MTHFCCVIDLDDTIIVGQTDQPKFGSHEPVHLALVCGPFDPLTLELFSIANIPITTNHAFKFYKTLNEFKM